MVKIIKKIDLNKVYDPSVLLERYLVKSKNRKSCKDTAIHHNFGKLTASEVKQFCNDLNQKHDGRFYWPHRIQ